ncbi:MAG: penicillin-binding transpeptidase domain-containing protein [Pelolinea sp.]|nr:penicillin-binding transpeptidase domain-containing protein [Pelolinea sp.]
MKFRNALFWLVIISIAATACGGKLPTNALPTPQIKVASAPKVDDTARAFLSAWESENYDAMYQQLSSASQQTVSAEDFSSFYKETAVNMNLQSLKTEFISSTTNPDSATAKYSASFTTGIFGSFEREIDMPMVLEKGAWKVSWDRGLVMPELAGGNRLQVESTGAPRGAIYDRNGEPIADQTTAYALAIIPNQIEDGKEGILLNQLSKLTGRTTEAIQESYADIRLTNWYVPVGEASEAEVQANWNVLSTLGGLQLSEFTSRYYYNGGIAPQALGYVQPIPEEQVDEFRLKGYFGNEDVGQAGLEKYAEDALAGKAAASLYVADANNQIISRLNQADPRPPQNITTTIDKNLQIEAQKALLGFKGAIVVMEVETGRVLAMASSPGFDPNLFEPDNRNSAEQLAGMLNDGQQRLLNRASQGSYPAGSIFKIIGMAAALESNLYTPETTYYCSSYFEELPGERFKDWTVDKELPPSGTLTLVQGLMRSCNPWFYHIGLDLFRQKGATYLSDMSRGFGLGSATGIEQVAENEGQIVDPKSDGDAVQQGIGQGNMLVTPLQVARFTAAIANGGTLYRPQIIEGITNASGENVVTFVPESNGTLPVSEATLEAIRTGMRAVVRSKTGTAHIPLGDLGIPIYGKTGTAENPLGDAHAWFTGFTSTPRTDRPDIAVTVIVENAGQGSEIAAPIFRRVIETYYFGEPQKLYPWESDFNVTRTPTPEVPPTVEGQSGSSSAPSVPGQVQSTPTPSG